MPSRGFSLDNRILPAVLKAKVTGGVSARRSLARFRRLAHPGSSPRAALTKRLPAHFVEVGQLACPAHEGLRIGGVGMGHGMKFVKG